MDGQETYSEGSSAHAHQNAAHHHLEVSSWRRYMVETHIMLQCKQGDVVEGDIGVQSEDLASDAGTENNVVMQEDKSQSRGKNQSEKDSSKDFTEPKSEVMAYPKQTIEGFSRASVVLFYEYFVSLGPLKAR